MNIQFASFIYLGHPASNQRVVEWLESVQAFPLSETAFLVYGIPDKTIAEEVQSRIGEKGAYFLSRLKLPAVHQGFQVDDHNETNILACLDTQSKLKEL